MNAFEGNVARFLQVGLSSASPSWLPSSPSKASSTLSSQPCCWPDISSTDHRTDAVVTATDTFSTIGVTEEEYCLVKKFEKQLGINQSNSNSIHGIREWYGINNQHFIRMCGSEAKKLLQKYRGLVSLIQRVYPNHAADLQLDCVPRGYWSNVLNQRDFCNHFAKQRNITAYGTLYLHTHHACTHTHLTDDLSL